MLTNSQKCSQKLSNGPHWSTLVQTGPNSQRGSKCSKWFQNGPNEHQGMLCVLLLPSYLLLSSCSSNESSWGVEIRPDWRNSSVGIYYYDQDSEAGLEKFICSSCSLHEYFSLQLRGICKYTLLGQQCFSSYIYIIFQKAPIQFRTQIRILFSMGGDMEA